MPALRSCPRWWLVVASVRLTAVARSQVQIPSPVSVSRIETSLDPDRIGQRLEPQSDF